eukprot:6471839-Amphidinium_carterae.1
MSPSGGYRVHHPPLTKVTHIAHTIARRLHVKQDRITFKVGHHDENTGQRTEHTLDDNQIVDELGTLYLYIRPLQPSRPMRKRPSSSTETLCHTTTTPKSTKLSDNDKDDERTRTSMKRPAACISHSSLPQKIIKHSFARSDHPTPLPLPTPLHITHHDHGTLTTPLPPTTSTDDHQLLIACTNSFDTCTKYTIETTNKEEPLQTIFLVRTSNLKHTPPQNLCHLSHPINFTALDLKRALAKLWKIAIKRINLKTQTVPFRSTPTVGTPTTTKIDTTPLADDLIIDDFKILRMSIDWNMQPTTTRQRTNTPDNTSTNQTPTTPPSLQPPSLQAIHCNIQHALHSLQQLPNLINQAFREGAGKEQERSSAIQQSIARQLNNLASTVLTTDQIKYLAKQEKQLIHVAKAETDAQARTALIAALTRLKLHHEASALRQQHNATSATTPSHAPTPPCHFHTHPPNWRSQCDQLNINTNTGSHNTHHSTRYTTYVHDTITTARIRTINRYTESAECCWQHRAPRHIDDTTVTTTHTKTCYNTTTCHNTIAIFHTNTYTGTTTTRTHLATCKYTTPSQLLQ